MGSREVTLVPETFGLQEFYVTEVETESADGGNVRLFCGVRRGNTTHWLYCVVMPADRLLANARKCELAALERFHDEESVSIYAH